MSILKNYGYGQPMEIQKKICLLGDFAVGKTSLVRRFVEGMFDEKYLSTLGAKVDRKSLVVPKSGDSVKMKLLIWDIAGGEKFSMMVRSYYNGASGAVLVCDLTRPETIASLERYTQDFWNINPNTPVIIAGNKIDLVNEVEEVTAQLADTASRYQASWFVSSAKTGENVETLFQILGQSLLSK
jgi:small GTP-binding protein